MPKTAVGADPAPRKLLRVIELEEALEGQHEYHLHGFAQYARGTLGHASSFLELCEIDEALSRSCHVRSDEPEAN